MKSSASRARSPPRREHTCRHAREDFPRPGSREEWNELRSRRENEHGIEQRDRNADECAVQQRTICTTGGQKAKAKSGDGSGDWTEPHSDAFREGLARLRIDASGLVDEYDHDEQQDGSELAGDRRQRDTAAPNSISSGHRADPVKGWREDTVWMARAGERADAH